MTHGFIIMLASNSFPGASCFVYKYSDKLWGRHTEREMAHVFSSESEARDVIRTMINEIRYEAPELNGALAYRLKEAAIVPA